MERRRVVILVGGKSGEHDISLASGAEVLRHVDRTRFDPAVLRVDRDGAWVFPESTEDVNAAGRRLTFAEGVMRLDALRPAAVFPLTHGPYGEDGHVQGLLDLLELPYVGSGLDASALCMNKARTRDVYRANNLPVARGEELRRGDRPSLSAPCVVKPLRLGSSVGLDIAHDAEHLERALRVAFEHDDRVLIEDFVSGEELTAGVLEELDGTARALPLVAIRPRTRAFFDLHAKYTPGATDEICPAPLDAALTLRLQGYAIEAHRVLGCRALSRTDMIVRPTGEVVLLETNTLPGFTRTSLLPQAACVAGRDYGRLVSHLLDHAIALGPRT